MMNGYLVGFPFLEFPLPKLTPFGEGLFRFMVV